ncbi:MAG: SLC13 family permease [Planctomycetaceae bacterium]
MVDAGNASRPETVARLGKVLGSLLFLAVLLSPTPSGMTSEAQRLAAVTLLMAVLWLTQALPVAVTSLVPLVLFPLLGIQSAKSVSQAYVNQYVFLFLGGFIIALGIEKWGLHRRMALHTVRVIGGSPRRLVLGFMVATAFLSMWISNTASTLLMMPIGLAILTSYREHAENEDQALIEQLSVVLMLGIAYAASIGGMTTLVGTPTNVAFTGIWEQQFPDASQLSAGQWMADWVPVGVVFLIIAWSVLTWRLPRSGHRDPLARNLISDQLRALGRPDRAQLAMLAVFVVTALLWVFRKPLQFGSEPLLPGWESVVEWALLRMGTEPELARTAVHDSTVAIAMAILMFLIPVRKTDSGATVYLMDWQTAEKLPWAMLLLIGGGFAIAGAFGSTDLAGWTGQFLSRSLAGVPPLLLIASICLLMTFLTEFTTNVATVTTILPVLAGASVKLGLDPRLVMIPATISASCAFMLPIATPPNAIIFGSGQVRISQMVRYGVVLNLIGVALVTSAAFFWITPQKEISPPSALRRGESVSQTGKPTNAVPQRFP